MAAIERVTDVTEEISARQISIAEEQTATTNELSRTTQHVANSVTGISQRIDRVAQTALNTSSQVWALSDASERLRDLSRRL